MHGSGVGDSYVKPSSTHDHHARHTLPSALLSLVTPGT